MIQLKKIKNELIRIRRAFVLFVGQNLKHTYLKVYLIVCFALNLLLWITAISIKNNIKEGLAILHYNVDFGIDLLGDPSSLLVIPSFGLIVILINSILTSVFVKFDKFKFISHLFLLTALVVNVFLILSLLFIYLINFKN